MQHPTVISTLPHLTSASPASATPPPHHATLLSRHKLISPLSASQPLSHHYIILYPTSQVSRVSPSSLQHPITISPGPDRGPTSIAPVPCIIGPVSLQYYISSVSRQYLTSTSPVPHHPHYLTSVSRASHQYSVISISSSSRQYLTSNRVSHHDSRSLLITGPAPRQLTEHQRIAFICDQGSHRSASTVAMWLVMTGLGPPMAAYDSAVVCELPGAAKLQTRACVPQTTADAHTRCSQLGGPGRLLHGDRRVRRPGGDPAVHRPDLTAWQAAWQLAMRQAPGSH